MLLSTRQKWKVTSGFDKKQMESYARQSVFGLPGQRLGQNAGTCGIWLKEKIQMIYAHHALPVGYVSLFIKEI